MKLWKEGIFSKQAWSLTYLLEGIQKSSIFHPFFSMHLPDSHSLVSRRGGVLQGRVGRSLFYCQIPLMHVVNRKVLGPGPLKRGEVILLSGWWLWSLYRMVLIRIGYLPVLYKIRHGNIDKTISSGQLEEGQMKSLISGFIPPPLFITNDHSFHPTVYW